MRHVAKESWWRERRRDTRRRFRGFELIVSKCVVTNIVGCPNGLPIAQQPKTHEDCSQAAPPPFLVYLCWLLICIDFVQQIKRFVFASFLSHLLFTPPPHSLYFPLPLSYTNKFVSISCSSIRSLSLSACCFPTLIRFACSKNKIRLAFSALALLMFFAALSWYHYYWNERMRFITSLEQSSASNMFT